MKRTQSIKGVLLMDCFTIGDYTVTFDEQGACIERRRPYAIYRVTATTATNAIDFMRHHRTLCFAMMKNHPEDLLAYKCETLPKAVGDEIL